MTIARIMILVGSKSDIPIMEETQNLLKELGIANELHVASAHRTPERVAKLAGEAQGRGVKVIIAAAGLAAHLAGAVAAQTTLPVIGVPLEGSSIGGLDSLLSTVQMPAGIPVATVAIGKHGAKNAAILAAQILALSDDALSKKLIDYRKKLSESVRQ